MTKPIRSSHVHAVVGGQFGSEGKGLIVGHIARHYNRHIRVGAANAGHTIYTQDPVSDEPVKHVMQQIPCAAYANPFATLLLGPGALITPHILAEELTRLGNWRIHQGMYPEPLLIIDPRAHVITADHIEREKLGDLQARIGSTSATANEGIGEAAADRVLRAPSAVTAERYFDPIDKKGLDLGDGNGLLRACDIPGLYLGDVPKLIWGQRHPAVGGVLLEGTQGDGLSNITGQFPYVTSRGTSASSLAADCGIGPTYISRVTMVCRTYPIRVAGNSGPFHPGSSEIDWTSIGVDEDTERTTVTKKVRRVATFSLDQVAEAALHNSATDIALTFCDYLDPALTGVTGSWDWKRLARTSPAVFDLVESIQEETDTPVRYLGTGPHHIIELEQEA